LTDVSSSQKINGDDLDSVRLVAVLLQKCEKMEPDHSILLHSEWRSIGDGEAYLYHRLTNMLHEMERNNIIHSLAFPSGGASMFTLTERHRYVEYLSNHGIVVKKVIAEELVMKGIELSRDDLSIIILKRLDPDLSGLEKWIYFSNQPEDFEKAITLLLCLCGFRALHVGDDYQQVSLLNRRDKYTKSKISIDVIAFSPLGSEVFICQCTTEWNDHKVIDLINITSELRGTISSPKNKKIYPVIITRVSENQLKESLVKAKEKYVTVLTRESLAKLLDEVKRNLSPYEMSYNLLLSSGKVSP
jgi:hypothetical protein